MNKLSEQQVVDYLEENTDFLVNNPNLLSQLDLIQQQTGVSSLAIRQQKILREKNQDLKQNLADLIKIAKKNESIFQTFSACYRDLMVTDNFDDLSKQLKHVICQDSEIKECQLIQYHIKLNSIITHRLTEHKHYLGRPTQDEISILFNEDCQSIALYLIGDIDSPLGVLAFSSDDPFHYTPSQDNLFIKEFVQALAIKLSEF
jgi:uncharacterized protein YigA (DUF484 family)